MRRLSQSLLVALPLAFLGAIVLRWIGTDAIWFYGLGWMLGMACLLRALAPLHQTPSRAYFAERGWSMHLSMLSSDSMDDDVLARQGTSGGSQFADARLLFRAIKVAELSRWSLFGLGLEVLGFAAIRSLRLLLLIPCVAAFLIIGPSAQVAVVSIAAYGAFIALSAVVDYLLSRHHESQEK